MSSFNEPLTVTKIGGGKWKVAREFRYYIGSLNSELFVDVPEGFITDFASIPRAFWTILPPDGQYTQAAVLHDFLYSKKGKVFEIPLNRKDCDEIFAESMKVLGVSSWKINVMYSAVRSFGWIPWNKKGD